jgi:hypothetical protein
MTLEAENQPENRDDSGSDSSHCYVPHRGPDEPLTRDEQDDLFKQMTLWINSGGLRESKMLACEMENIFRMKATIVQLRADVGGGDTAISQLEQGIEALEQENRDLREHFEKFTGFAATCRRENTYEWMCLMLDWLNGAATRLDPDKYFDIVGADHFAMRHVPRTVST